jgi:hypothetical protein
MKHSLDYWLIELVTNPPSSPLYYTAPSEWGSAVNLATKFNTEAGANAEAEYLRNPKSPHEVVVQGHSWSTN